MPFVQGTKYLCQLLPFERLSRKSEVDFWCYPQKKSSSQIIPQYSFKYCAIYITFFCLQANACLLDDTQMPRPLMVYMLYNKSKYHERLLWRKYWILTQADKLAFKHATASAVHLVSHTTGTCFCTSTTDCLFRSLSSSTLRNATLTIICKDIKNATK